MLHLYFVPVADNYGGRGGGAVLVAANDREHAIALARSHCIESGYGRQAEVVAHEAVGIETPVIEGVLAENIVL